MKGPREFEGKKDFNIIYKVWENVFIHAFSVKSIDGFNQYTIIEPPRPSLKSLDKVEDLFAKSVGDEEPRRTSRRRRNSLGALCKKFSRDSTQVSDL